MRRFVPFGTHWAMGIDLPYSLAVIDKGALWSCGQCPLDMKAEALCKGDLAAQTRITAGFIRDQFTPHGVAPERIGKLVAYCVADARTSLRDVEGILKEELGGVPIVTAVGVPHFYYDGMMIEIDVYGSPDNSPALIADGSGVRLARSGPFVHARLALKQGDDEAAAVAALEHGLRQAGTSSQALLSARLYADPAHAGAGIATVLAEAIGTDAGRVIGAKLSDGVRLVADLVFDRSGASGKPPALVQAAGGVRLETRRTAGFLGLAGRVATAGVAMPEATRRIMAAIDGALADAGRSFVDVVKQQTHYVGGASAEDLYVNMRIRNGYYTKPGPASTGLAVHGFADANANISIEVLAVT